MLEYKSMSILDVPRGGIIMLACNAQGVWDSEIGMRLRLNLPGSFESYSAYCLDKLALGKKGAVGTGLITHPENGYRVGCLITSVDKYDSLTAVVAQTYLALDNFFDDYLEFGLQGTPIYSDKFNSGMFKVPWEETEKAVKYFTELYDINWIVCDPG